MVVGQQQLLSTTPITGINNQGAPIGLDVGITAGGTTFVTQHRNKGVTD